MQATTQIDLSALLAALPLDTNEMTWVKSLDLVYGTKDPQQNPHKVVEVDGDALHVDLRAIENQETRIARL